MRPLWLPRLWLALCAAACACCAGCAGCAGRAGRAGVGQPRPLAPASDSKARTGSMALPRAFQPREAVGNTWLGPRNAAVTIEVFSDFQCPFCASSHHVLTKLGARFPRDLRIRHRDLPLDVACNPRIHRPFHDRACEAAVHARCAAAQGKFWPYATLLASNYRALDAATLRTYAVKLDLRIERFERCLSGKAAREALQTDIEEAGRRGITGTPTFYLDGKQLRGHQGLAQWIQRIEQAIATAHSR